MNLAFVPTPMLLNDVWIGFVVVTTALVSLLVCLWPRGDAKFVNDCPKENHNDNRNTKYS